MIATSQVSQTSQKDVEVVQATASEPPLSTPEVHAPILPLPTPHDQKLNLDRLIAITWDEMGLVRVYTKPQGQQPDFSDPVVLSADRGGCTVEDFCNHILRSLVKDVKYVLVWGTSARHYPQHCGLAHVLHDEDVVQIVKKQKNGGEGRGRFKSYSTAPARISDRQKEASLEAMSRGTKQT